MREEGQDRGRDDAAGTGSAAADAKRGARHGPGHGVMLEALARALGLVRARVAPDITAQRLSILLAVAANEGLSQREMLQRLEGTSITALSRNLADLSALTSRKQPGPELVELRTDPMNLRVKRVFLTRRGRRLLRDIEQAMAVDGRGGASA